jgi:glyoxylase-like metal-dependent hydrolase (beta-lactamase superfamily II)
VTVDLRLFRQREVLSAYLVLDRNERAVMVESGPGSTRRRLEREIRAVGLARDDLLALCLTHIHLDHAGAAGFVARRTGCRVCVHPAGAPHLADPEAKLLPSARRIYGPLLGAVWGPMEPVPGGQIEPVDHGERFRFSGLELVAWHTPGHARHHVVWQLEGDLFTGDLAGVRLPGSNHVLPPTPPPDIDLEAWRASLRLVRDLEPRRLFLTHFGVVEEVRWHLDELEARLERWRELALSVLQEGGGRPELVDRLRELDDAEMRAAGVPAAVARRYRRLCPVADNAAGLLRAVQ